MGDALEVVKRYCRDRDPEAFAHLVSEYRPLVESICRRYVIEPGDVEDAVQETFVKLARRAEVVEGNVGAWLAAVAGTTALDYARRTLRERSHRKRLVMEREDGRRDIPSWKRIEMRMNEALEGLAPEMRSLVMARFFLGEAIHQMAQKSGVDNSTMSRRVAKAVAKVRRGLKAMGYASLEETLLASDELDIGSRTVQRDNAWWRRGGRLRVGVLLSHQTAMLKLAELTPFVSNKKFRPSADFQLSPTGPFHGEKYQLIGMLEPGTEELSPIEKGLRDFDITQGVVDATDAEALKTLDVIVAGHAFAVTSRLLQAIEAAVESGVGLYHEGQMGRDFPGLRDPRVCRLMLTDRLSMHHTLPVHEAPMAATVIAEHPILPGVAVGTRSEVAGCGPVYVPTAPGAKVLMHKDDPVNPQDPPIEALNGLRMPTLVVGKLGKGRVAMVGVRLLEPLLSLPGLRGNFVHHVLDWLAEERVGERKLWGMTNNQ